MSEAIAFMVGLALGILLCGLLAMPADAHDAPSGWQYDAWCCSNQDCRQARPDEVELVPDGWYVTTTGETMRLGDPHLLQSKDDHFHVCITTHHVDYSPKLHLLCLYAPPARF